MNDMTEWKVERLDAHHDRSEFVCGQPSLDIWIRQYAGQHEKRDLARTYVLVRVGEARIVGYYAISASQLAASILPTETAKKLPKDAALPAILIGRLAIDSSYHGQGLGGGLIMNALRRVLFLAERVGVMAVVVDAIDDQAVSFYLRHQFIPLLDDPRHLFLTVTTIRKLGLEAMTG
jgi:GNAT superfamily N-acetyltransferase